MVCGQGVGETWNGLKRGTRKEASTQNNARVRANSLHWFLVSGLGGAVREDPPRSGRRRLVRLGLGLGGWG